MPVLAQQTAPGDGGEASRLLGGYGPYRSNNRLLYYHLNLRVDPAAKFIGGHNDMRFRMLADGTRIQMDLVPVFTIEKVLLLSDGGTVLPMHVERAAGRTVYLDAPRTLRKGKVYTIQFFYSGHPVEMGRFGGMTFRTDPAGRPLVNTACEEEGASVWWPNKDQWREEVESMDVSIEAPTGMTVISGGRLLHTTPLPSGYTRWDWHVSYPINNYDVSLNIGTYTHFSDSYNGLTLDYYVFPEDLEKAEAQFTQVKDMLRAYEHYFGPYPFPRDGYKLVEALYSGVENQTAITYGNGFKNGYLGQPKTGIGARFDFIIIHESAHEYFGNSITAKDRSDMWIHEGWANYCESLFVEFLYGKADALTYLNTGKGNVKNIDPVIAPEGVDATPPVDQYKKGALFLNTLRSVIGDDAVWFRLLHDYYQRFKYQTIMTTDVEAFFQHGTPVPLKPIFDQYLRHAHVPVLELQFDASGRNVRYRWRADEAGFAMPIQVGDPAHWQTIVPVTTTWQTLETSLSSANFKVATDLYYVAVERN